MLSELLGYIIFYCQLRPYFLFYQRTDNSAHTSALRNTTQRQKHRQQHTKTATTTESKQHNNMAEQEPKGIIDRKAKPGELEEMTYLLLSLDKEEKEEPRAKQLPQLCEASPAAAAVEKKEEKRESTPKEIPVPAAAAAQVVVPDEEEEGVLHIKEDDEDEDQDVAMKDRPAEQGQEDSPATVRHSIDFLLNHKPAAAAAGAEEAESSKRRRSEREDDTHSHKRSHTQREEEERELIRARRKEHLSPARILASLATLGLDNEPPRPPTGSPQAVVSRLPPLRSVHHSYSLRGHSSHTSSRYAEDSLDHLPGVSTLLQPATPSLPVSLAPRATSSRQLPEKLKPLRLQERLAKQASQQHTPVQLDITEGQYDVEPYPSYDYGPPSPSQLPRQHARLEVEDQLMMRKRRKRATADQVAFLEASFAENPLPDTETKNRIAQQLGMTTRRVTIWYD